MKVLRVSCYVLAVAVLLMVAVVAAVFFVPTVPAGRESLAVLAAENAVAERLRSPEDARFEFWRAEPAGRSWRVEGSIETPDPYDAALRAHWIAFVRLNGRWKCERLQFSP